MSQDVRSVLEEAWNVIHPFNNSASDCNFPKACRKCDRFRRFLDAEAWTDAAMMLIPERYKDDYEIGPRYSRLGLDYDCADHWGWSDVPALSLAEACLAACLKAKEQADG